MNSCPTKLLKLQSGLLLVFSVLFMFMSLDLQARTVCTMTFNSPWEQLLFQTELGDSNTQFIELVPNIRDDRWLDKACKNPKAQCDMLIVSGHFAGEFFGVSDQQVEGYNNQGLTLSLLDLEAASCRADCEGIFKKPQDVFLLGCNTLAGKSPDGRTFSEYINNLLEDGFDRELAETVALTQYSHLGLTMAERFESVFPQTPRIHGFKARGPLGKNLVPRLKKAFNFSRSEDYFTHGLSLQAALKGAAYQLSKGEILKEKPSLNRKLLCSAQNLFPEERDAIFQSLFTVGTFERHFDSFFRSFQTPSTTAFKTSLMNWINANESHSEAVKQALLRLKRRTETTLGIQLQIIDLQLLLNWKTKVDAQEEKTALLREHLNHQPMLTYHQAEQICSLRHLLSGVTSTSLTLNSNLIQSEFFEQIQNCLGERSLQNNFLSVDNKALVTSVKQCFASGVILKNRSETERDSLRWQCIEPLIPTEKKNEALQTLSLEECLMMTPKFETVDKRSYVDWKCLLNPTYKINLKSCLIASARNNDPANGDDMIWKCWGRMNQNPDFNQAQCLGLTMAMKLHGNRLKMNWKCLH